MKNLVKLTTVKEIDEFVFRLWKSDLIKESHRSGGYVWDLVNRFAYLPRMFAEVSNEYLERSHFSTWWNVIMMRDYENPYINDLYYLHEMTHARRCHTWTGIGREAFDEKMQRNELEASVLSEIAIYFELPELRKLSFDHSIYADRYLQDEKMRNLWRTNRDTAVETLRTMRRDVMVSKPERDLDVPEEWIRRFNNQNAIYFGIWADRYGDIESRMALFQQTACDDFEDGRMMAIGFLKKWIEDEAAKDAFDHIPFRLEAELFAPVYWANKAKYDEAMKRMPRSL
jgi:hypothetical protein